MMTPSEIAQRADELERAHRHTCHLRLFGQTCSYRERLKTISRAAAVLDENELFIRMVMLQEERAAHAPAVGAA